MFPSELPKRVSHYRWNSADPPTIESLSLGELLPYLCSRRSIGIDRKLDRRRVLPRSFFDTVRQHISCYTWDHYAEFDPLEVVSEALPKPGSIRRVLEAGLSLCDSYWPGPTLEIGCGVGRTTFDLASRFDGDVLGIDVHFSMLRIASHVLQKGVVSYPRRRSGWSMTVASFPFPCRAKGMWTFGCATLMPSLFPHRGFTVAWPSMFSIRCVHPSTFCSRSTKSCIPKGKLC